MIILDTHIWVRWIESDKQPLPKPIIDYIETADSVAVSAVSAISCWEVALLVKRKRVKLKLNLDEWIEQALTGSDVICIPVDKNIATCAANLPEHHRDPADRMIIATAIETKSQLISLDTEFPKYTEIASSLIAN